jgi:hypothetical protein
LRFESVEQDGATQTAEAIALRGRLGFESGKIAGTALLAEGEFIRPIVEDYNSTINGNGVYPVVAGYGSEADLQAQAKWRRLTGTLKYANYEADRLLTGTMKWWLQLEYVW